MRLGALEWQAQEEVEDMKEQEEGEGVKRGRGREGNILSKFAISERGKGEGGTAMADFFCPDYFL